MVLCNDGEWFVFVWHRREDRGALLGDGGLHGARIGRSVLSEHRGRPQRSLCLVFEEEGGQRK